jgi:hypothetical protein
LVVPLGAEIIEQDRFVDLRKGAWRMGEPPAGEVKEIVGISTQRAQRQATNAQCIEEFIEPRGLTGLLVGDAIRRDAER